MKYLVLLMFSTALFTSCGKNQIEIDEELILSWLDEHGLTAQSTPEGLFYIIDSEGTGTRPDINSTVTVDYEGFLLNGTKFDSSIDRGMPSEFPLSGVIQGWQIGIPLFREGGSGTLFIPSDLGYSNNPPPGSVIPDNAVLRFTVHLIDVQ